MDAVDCMFLFFCHDGVGVRPIDSVRRDARFKLFPAGALMHVVTARRY
jgi:hypothetical protein